jgi:UDP-2,4-diacetamido-2,4,6-trideoxy-beta-L-altropyranose hydrolase
MRMVIRADSSAELGLGHIMRCRTLAEALRDRGCAIRFVCRTDPGNANHLISAAGFELIQLSSLPGRPKGGEISDQGADWKTDAEQVRLCAEEFDADWVIVDHYGVDSRWEAAVAQAGTGDARRVMVIDDLADRPHRCDVLLDQTIGRTKAAYVHLVPENCAVLCGPEYALVRQEFSARAHDARQSRGTRQLSRILVSMGGTDSRNATGRVLDAMESLAIPTNCTIAVVLGPGAPWKDELEAQILESRHDVRLHIAPESMADLMAGSDLAIGAAGSTSWERCCLGLPTIMIVTAENQSLIANNLDAAGGAWSVGRIDEPAFVKTFTAALCRAFSDPDALTAMSIRAAAIADGLGADRIADALSNLDRS